MKTIDRNATYSEAMFLASKEAAKKLEAHGREGVPGHACISRQYGRKLWEQMREKKFQMPSLKQDPAPLRPGARVNSGWRAVTVATIDRAPSPAASPKKKRGASRR
jgi:DNA-directed RNA polymerase subunit H (RpoH/RPB5)